MKNDVWVILIILIYQIFARLVARKEHNRPNIDERELFYAPKWLSKLVGSKRKDGKLSYPLLVYEVTFFILNLLTLLMALKIIDISFVFVKFVVVIAALLMVNSFRNDTIK